VVLVTLEGQNVYSIELCLSPPGANFVVQNLALDPPMFRSAVTPARLSTSALPMLLPLVVQCASMIPGSG